MNESVVVGYQTFVSDSPDEFGAVRAVSDSGQSMTVYVENAGEFILPVEAVISVQSAKVTFDRQKLEPRVREAIAHAHDAEWQKV